MRKGILFIILLTSFLITMCSDTFMKVDDDEKLESDEAILYFNLYYLEGIPVNSIVNLVFESIDRTYFYRVDVDKNDKRTILLKLKAGSYYFSEVRTQADADYATVEGKTDVPSFEGPVHENVFTLKPGKINYIGDITLQVRRQNIGKLFTIRAINGPGREDMYIWDVHMTKSLNAFKKSFPNLVKRYEIEKTRIFYGNDSLAFKEKAAVESTDQGYGRFSFGKDKKGYGNYKWGMDKQAIQRQFKARKLTYKELNPYVYVNKNKSANTYFYFSKLENQLWNKRLFMVKIFYKNASMLPLKKAISDNYGSPIERDYKLIWELPTTQISLTRFKGQPLVEYISKNHEKFKADYDFK